MTVLSHRGTFSGGHERGAPNFALGIGLDRIGDDPVTFPMVIAVNPNPVSIAGREPRTPVSDGHGHGARSPILGKVGSEN